MILSQFISISPESATTVSPNTWGCPRIIFSDTPLNVLSGSPIWSRMLMPQIIGCFFDVDWVKAHVGLLPVQRQMSFARRRAMICWKVSNSVIVSLLNNYHRNTKLPTFLHGLFFPFKPPQKLKPFLADHYPGTSPHRLSHQQASDYPESSDVPHIPPKDNRKTIEAPLDSRNKNPLS